MTQSIQSFIDRWKSSGAAERANYQLFLSELCDILDVPHPDPATPDTTQNAYVFERAVTFQYTDGTSSAGRIDLYKRNCFVLEAKQGTESPTGDHALPLSQTLADQQRKLGKGIGRRGSPAWDDAMVRARGQAEQYTRALPPEEGRPPFLVIVDVGHSIELFSEFSCSGGTYIPFPAPGSHRVLLSALAKDEVREQLKAVWEDPASLDPTRRSARVTREIADRLARLAISLEKGGHDPHTVASFLMRCLFTMFAEDIGLLTKDGFTDLIEGMKDTPDHFAPVVEELWGQMNLGGFSTILRTQVLQFNGGLFEDATALPLNRDQLLLLIEAARCDWRDVEPAIFGTLLERALDPVERHKLGAHYTPRSYVERLVMPTIINSIREEWAAVRTAALVLVNDDKMKEALAEIQKYHSKLVSIRVLDPACGSGNFLYVTLEHLKRIEGEIFDTLDGLGHTQFVMEMSSGTVDPHQLLGLEVNPRAAAIAELVLWIGTLQWHFRNRGRVMPPQPIIKNFHNIECRDALIEWDSVEPYLDAEGSPVSHWDGRTTKRHPVTGEEVPDESAQVPELHYVAVRPAKWPISDYIVGNPPFIGSKRMRAVLGDGYVDAIQNAYPEVPQSTDFVMRWWHKAAEAVRTSPVQRAGLITTNTMGQTYVRRVVENHLSAKNPIHIAYAVPDHPWVDSSDGASVRISMSVISNGSSAGTLETVVMEAARGSGHEDRVLKTVRSFGKIHADLSIGSDLTKAAPLESNRDLCSVGMKTIGAAFQIDSKRAKELGIGRIGSLDAHIKPYMNGREFASMKADKYVVDFFGLSESLVRERYPDAYQYLLVNAKPDRRANRNRIFREQWWIIGHPRPQFRNATTGLARYIATIETSKHRFFGLVDIATVPDSTLVTFALDDAYFLGVLSSRVHVCWALASGGTLEDRPRYNKTRCFETFPFPATTAQQKQPIRALAEQLDAHRKSRQAEHPKLTMTGMYNVLEKLRSGEPLADKEKTVHEQGLVSVLKQLHDELDEAVCAAYGWPSDITDSSILERLVALNAERAAEEARGKIQWLRPDFQCANGPAQQSELDIADSASAGTPKSTSATKLPWPATLPEQVSAVRSALADAGRPVAADEVARRFMRARTAKISPILDTLVAVGQARRMDDGRFVSGS